MKLLFGLILISAVSLALAEDHGRIFDLYEAGVGRCFLCAQKTGGERSCCSGNIYCESDNGSASCHLTEAPRMDIQRAHPEFLAQQKVRGLEAEFCSICCGIDSTSTQCCSGVSYCGCTKFMYPSCV